MVQITENDLLMYLYKDGTAEKLQKIKTSLATDEDLQEKFQQLKMVTERLDQIKLLFPAKKSLENILNYAEQSVAELNSNN